VPSFRETKPTATIFRRRPRSFAAGALALAAAVVVIHPGSASPRAAASGQHRLLPDITTMKIGSHDLVVRSSGSRTLLRLTNRVANRGRGPLEIHPSAKSHGCDHDGDPSNDRDAIQRVFLDANRDHVFERHTDADFERSRFGCERYDPVAGRWNVYDLARYKLRRLHSHKTVAQTAKVAFCTVDGERVYPRLPGSPRLDYYPRGDCDRSSTLGISVGWADEYYYVLPGQALDVTGVKGGRYCLVSTADPHRLLRESDNSNNTRKTRIELHPSKHTAEPLPGRCPSSG
jgi:Lysyl oxidase